MKALPCRLQNDSPTHLLTNGTNTNNDVYSLEPPQETNNTNEKYTLENNNSIKMATIPSSHTIDRTINETNYVNNTKITQPNDVLRMTQNSSDTVNNNNFDASNIRHDGEHDRSNKTNKLHQFYLHINPTTECSNNNNSGQQYASQSPPNKSIMSILNQKQIQSVSSSSNSNSTLNHNNSNNVINNGYINTQIVNNGNNKIHFINHFHH